MTVSLPWSALFGGMLLGTSAFLLLFFNGKVAGISGIVSGLLPNKEGASYWQSSRWQWLFVIGMVAGGFLASGLSAGMLPTEYNASYTTIIIAGFLVGMGTRIGNGCTSGHGICGIGRGSLRSVVATCVFMFVAAVVVAIRLHA